MGKVSKKRAIKLFLRKVFKLLKKQRYMERRGCTLIFLTAIISGISIFLNKYAVSVINPYGFTFLKNVIVAIFLFAILFMFRNIHEMRSMSRRHWLFLILIGLVGGSIPFLFFFKGLSITSSAMGSFIHKTMFVYVGILAVTFLREKLNKSIFLAAVFLLLGNLFLLKMKAFSFNIGDMFILIATVFWSVENILSKHIVKELSGNMVAFGRMFFGSIFILLFLMFTKQSSSITTMNTQQILWTLFTAALLCGYVLTWYNGIKSIKITIATSILLLGSPITTLLNLLAGSSITAIEIIGFIFIFVGITTMILFVEKMKHVSPLSQQHNRNVS